MENLNQTDICKAGYHASDIAERLAIAYWMKGADKAFHLEEAERSLAALLDTVRGAEFK